MRWILSSLINEIQNLLYRRPHHAPCDGIIALNNIREAMLDCLDGWDGKGENPHAQVERKIVYANNLQDLWYLRGDVMAIIASIDGEAAARNRIARISDMFKGLLPKGLKSRPSPLSH